MVATWLRMLWTGVVFSLGDNLTYTLAAWQADESFRCFNVAVGVVFLSLYAARRTRRNRRQLIGRDTLLDTMPEGVLMVDQHNRVVDINPAALVLLGRDRESVIGKPVQKALAPWRRWFEQFLDAPQAQAELTTSDDPPRHFNLKITPLRDPLDMSLGRLIVIRDLTELKQSAQTLQQRIAELTTVNSITQALSEQIDLAKMIQLAGDRVREILNAQGFYIALYDSQLQMISFPYWRSMIKQFYVSSVPLGKGLASYVITRRQPLIINEAYPERSAELGVIRPLKDRPIGLPASWIGVPMIVADQVIGMISAQNFDQENAFSETDLQLWTTIAAVLGTAIRNAQLYSETQRSAAQMTALNQLSLAINEGLGMDRLLPTLHQQCKKIAPIDIFSVTLYDHTTRQSRIVFFDDGGQIQSLPSVPFYPAARLNDSIIATRQTLYIPDSLAVDQAADQPAYLSGGEQAHTFLGVPLVQRDQVVGVITAQSYAINAFTPQQIDLFEMFAVQAAIVVQNSRLYEQVQTLATTDELTRLPNRRALFEKGGYELMRAQRFNHPLSVVMLDIDHFKKVNDQFGHAAGDLVLRQIAESFQGSLRTIDLPARYGGEEFVVLLPETSELLAAQIAERLRSQIANLPISISGERLRVTVSLGVASSVQENLDFSRLISCADQALYQSKRDGRNRVTLWKAADVGG